MERNAEADSPSILSYLHDPELPTSLIEGFFSAAIDYADAGPWDRLRHASHFPVLLEVRQAGARPQRRLAMILGGAGSGGDALGLVLVEDLPEVPEGGEAVLSHPALTVLYAGYPDEDMAPLRWRGGVLPRSRAGLLPWPTVHDIDDRVRAPGRQELALLTAGLLVMNKFLRGYPDAMLDDHAPRLHRCEVTYEAAPERLRVGASTFIPGAGMAGMPAMPCA